MPPAVALVYTGHLLKAGERDGATLRAAERAIRRGVDAALDAEPVAGLHGALACGSDILVAEAGLERGLQLHVVLPFEREAFARISVEIGEPSSAWRGRFDACLSAAASLEVLESAMPAAADLRDALFFQALRHAGGRAIEAAAAAGGEPVLLAVQDRGHEGNLAGSSRGANDWRQTGRRLLAVPFPFRRDPAPGGAAGPALLGALAARLAADGQAPGSPVEISDALVGGIDAASPVLLDHGLRDDDAVARRLTDAAAVLRAAADGTLATAAFAMEALYRGADPRRFVPAGEVPVGMPPLFYRILDAPERCESPPGG